MFSAQESSGMLSPSSAEAAGAVAAPAGATTLAAGAGVGAGGAAFAKLSADCLSKLSFPNDIAFAESFSQGSRRGGPCSSRTILECVEFDVSTSGEAQGRLSWYFRPPWVGPALAPIVTMYIPPIVRAYGAALYICPIGV